jgi:hypothetical protein
MRAASDRLFRARPGAAPAARGAFLIELALLLPTLLGIALLVFDVRFYLDQESEVQYLMREIAVSAYHECYGIYSAAPEIVQTCFESAMYEELAFARESQKEVKIILSAYGRDGVNGIRQLALTEASTATAILEAEHSRLDPASAGQRYGKLLADVEALLIVEVIVPFRPLLGSLSFFRTGIQYAAAGV